MTFEFTYASSGNKFKVSDTYRLPYYSESNETPTWRLKNTGTGNEEDGSGSQLSGLDPDETYEVTMFFKYNTDAGLSWDYNGQVQIEVDNKRESYNPTNKIIDFGTLPLASNNKRPFYHYEGTFAVNPGVPEIVLETNLNACFENYTGSNVPELESWNMANVISTSKMFEGALAFNQPLDVWNVSNVTNMSDMFRRAENFAQPLYSWNVSNVTDMSSMFGQETKFNLHLNTWNTSKVTNMQAMFFGSKFNKDILSWNVSNVTNMKSMFRGAGEFDQDLNTWNISRVTDMSFMFMNTSFNKNIGSWNVSNVMYMNSMFEENRLFNQDLSSWNVENVTNHSRIFHLNSRMTDAHNPFIEPEPEPEPEP